ISHRSSATFNDSYKPFIDKKSVISSYNGCNFLIVRNKIVTSPIIPIVIKRSGVHTCQEETYTGTSDGLLYSPDCIATTAGFTKASPTIFGIKKITTTSTAKITGAINIPAGASFGSTGSDLFFLFPANVLNTK